MRIAIITDVWEPQVNGVVHALQGTQQTLRDEGHHVQVVAPDVRRTFACPSKPEIRLAYKPYGRVESALDSFKPDCIHIATEGPMGLAARRYCLNRGFDFTTAYHTPLPEYLRARLFFPLAATYRWLRWFHGPSKAIMVPTLRLRGALEERGFCNVTLSGRGVDTRHFKPAEQADERIHAPLFLYVGRVAAEKNIEAFLRLDLPGVKWVIGDGPQKEELERKYPDVRFLDTKSHENLPAYYRCADVLVSPGLIDTFGLALIEAMACGVPVAAHPVSGPLDVVVHGRSGMLNHDLEQACRDALTLDRAEVRDYALQFSWEAASRQFLQNLCPARGYALPGYRRCDDQDRAGAIVQAQAVTHIASTNNSDSANTGSVPARRQVVTGTETGNAAIS